MNKKMLVFAILISLSVQTVIQASGCPKFDQDYRVQRARPQTAALVCAKVYANNLRLQYGEVWTMLVPRSFMTDDFRQGLVALNQHDVKIVLAVNQSK
jgi:hypothetical protein